MTALGFKSNERRRVRVSFEGDAVTRFDGAALLVRLEHGCITVPLTAGDVTVEDIAPPREWRDGDVVQHVTELWTLTRQFGRWVSSRGVDSWTDESVSRHIVDNGNGWDHLAVLRYQASETE